MALYANGRAPDSALVTYRGCKASPDMARRVAWVEAEYMRRNPSGYITPNEIYRDYDAQIYWKQYWTDRGYPGNAAAPGYSNHGDWDVGAVDWDADNIDLRTELAAQVGLIRTMLPQESWHYAVRGEPQVDLSGIAADTITQFSPEEDAMTPEQEAKLDGLIWTVGQMKPVLDDLNSGKGALHAKLDTLLWAVGDKASGLRTMVGDLIAKLGK